MSKVYNTQGDIANNLSIFLNSIYTLSKPQAKILPYIIEGMIESESVVTVDIVKKLKGHFQHVKTESNERRIRRFFNSTTFNVYLLYDSFIKQIIRNYKVKHKDKRVHISYDHVFIKDKWTILLFSLRIGRQAIPLWFRCFKAKADAEARNEKTIVEGINYIHNLFKDRRDEKVEIVYLADRWFNSVRVMKHISTLGDKFVIRVKTNIKVKVYDEKEGHEIWKFISEMKPYVYKSKLFHNIIFSNRNQYKANLVISKSTGVKEAWYLITNGEVEKAVKDYGYRWSIECLFKNQKSNGFYLESTNVRNTKAFSTMYGIMNIAVVWVTILGIGYSKNKHHIKEVGIADTKKHHGIVKRIISYYNLGLIYFNLALNSPREIKLRYDFKLYDT